MNKIKHTETVLRGSMLKMQVLSLKEEEEEDQVMLREEKKNHEKDSTNKNSTARGTYYGWWQEMHIGKPRRSGNIIIRRQWRDCKSSEPTYAGFHWCLPQLDMWWCTCYTHDSLHLSKSFYIITSTDIAGCSELSIASSNIYSIFTWSPSSVPLLNPFNQRKTSTFI